jgi:ABC-type phosphate transport system, periplasmic component
MSRTLGIAINQPMNQPLSLALQAFIDFVLSPEGQSIATKAGYVSLP